MGKCNSSAHFKAYPRELPTLILSGDADPVGAYGNGVRAVYKRLCREGACDLSMKIYEGASHELFNETNREEVFADLQSESKRGYTKISQSEFEKECTLFSLSGLVNVPEK